MPKDNDPMYGRRKPKRAHKERNRVHVSKFPALLDAAGARSSRDRVALALLIYTLARDGEITDLRIRDVDLDAGYIMMRVHKSRKEDRMPISAELDAELRRWLTVYSEEIGFLEPHYYLVPSRDTRGVPGEDGSFVEQRHVRFVPERRIPQLGKMVNPALEDIGFPTRDANGRPLWEGAHTARRSGARALFDSLSASGYDFALRVVQSMLHHSSMQTTEAYVGLSADRRSRDEIIRGKKMYDFGEGVVQLRREA
jgi:integrase